MNRRLQLYVWDGILEDYTGGIGAAVARSEASARRKLIKAYSETEDTQHPASVEREAAIMAAEISGPPSRVVSIKDGAVYCYGGG